MTIWESNGHVTDDVTWPERSRSWPQYTQSQISRKRLEIETWVQWTTNRKWPIEIRMVTWLMTSRDPERSRSWPQYIWGLLSRQRLEIRTWCQWSTYRKWLPGNQITWTMTSRDPEWSRSWHCVTLKVKIVPRIWYQFVIRFHRPHKQQEAMLSLG